ncbi:hypothetical protein [Paraferrimonas sp. SM1919]|uniref:hypothetical protein n=1 Tax=Paraferrimonas sp. SM1919 TaxID=2662263 RepID=UPI0013D7A586|nr:hypothetical protein [Paraferrimonas sp. SM1919]
MSSFNQIFIGLCLIVISLSLFQDKNDPKTIKPTVPKECVECIAQIEAVVAGEPIRFNLLKSLISKSYDEDKIERLILSLINMPEFNHKQKGVLISQLADIYKSRYHFYKAMTLLSKYESSYPEFSSKIKGINSQFESWQSERNTNLGYRSGRGNGTTGHMKGKVNVVYVHISDRKSKNKLWNTQLINRNKGNLSSVKDWLLQQAHLYNVSNFDINFHIHAVALHKGITSKWFRTQGFEFYFKSVFAKDIGFENSQQMLKHYSNNGRNEVAFVFHLNYSERSWAYRCGAETGYCNFLEFAMITEKPEDKYTPQVIAHEILHLFGSPDLYLIPYAKHFATTDVMNYYSSDLKWSAISPVTAWVIGWSEEHGKVPFKIIR